MRCCWGRAGKRRGDQIARAARGNERDREVYLNIAQVYERGRRYKEAEESARAAEVLPGRRGTMKWCGPARRHFERQKFFDKAEKQFKKVLAVNPRAHRAELLRLMLGDLGIRLDEAEALCSGR